MKIDAKARAIFFRSLSALFSSGVPLVRALELMGEQQESRRLAEACQGVARKVSEGNYLSRAMQQYPDVFQAVHHKMVQTGERSGQLHSVLLRLAEREERQQQLQQNFRGALMMPLIASGLCLALALLVPPFLFAGLFQMIREVGGDLPWTTRLLMGFSSLVTNPWGYPVLAALIWLARRAWSRLLQDEAWQFRFLQVPQLGPTVKLYLVAQFTQNLASMIEVGLPLLAALEQAARAVDAVCLDKVVERVTSRLKEGESLSASLEWADFFPSTLIQGVRASEEAGGLTLMLKNLHGLFALDLEQRIEVATKTFEPLVLGLVGAIVGFTLVATLQPMLSVLDRL